MPVVTISAPFGAAGSVVGPEVARRLNAPFVDRAIPAAVAAELQVSMTEALARDDRAAHGIARFFSMFARVQNVTLGGVEGYLPQEQLTDDEDFVRETERVIRDLAAGGNAVVLGRAAAIVLADHPTALHVRLTGSAERRLAQAVRRDGLDIDAARTQLRDNDSARRAYVRHFYNRDPEDVSLYHLVIDGTRLPVQTCADLIVAAVKALGPA
ncbi:MAG: cytidylate kinase-like family protein [Mycobacteriales bacterium]